MRSKKSRLALVGISALALSAFAVPSVAQGAKVTEKAGGGAVPDATVGPPAVTGEFVQTFNLKGAKVKKKQTLDVNVILNATGSTGTPVFPILFAPRGESVTLAPGTGGGVANIVNLKLDDQSKLTVFCSPLIVSRSNCNYLSGTSPNQTATGSIRTALNPTFKGINPKGKWTLVWQDTGNGGIATTVGESTLEVKTGKKFAKES